MHEAFPKAAHLRARLRPPRVPEAQGAPVAGVVREVLESAMQDGAAGDARASASTSEEIDRTEELYRARDRERLKAQIASGDIRAQIDRIITAPEPVVETTD